MGAGLCARGSKGSGTRALYVQEGPASIGAEGGALGRRNIARQREGRPIGEGRAREARRRWLRLGEGSTPELRRMGRGTIMALDWATAIRRGSPARGREIERRFSRAHLSVTSAQTEKGDIFQRPNSLKN